MANSTLLRYKLYTAQGSKKVMHPSYSGRGSFVYGIVHSEEANLTVTEDVSLHYDVTCFDGANGSITVVASRGTSPYQYSLDPTFATYNTDGVFNNLSLVGPVDEGTDEYGGILISHRRFYVRDASGQIASCVVDLRSPVELDWLNNPGDIIVFCDPTQTYATKPFDDLLLTTTANEGRITNTSNVQSTYNIGTTRVTYSAQNSRTCRERISCAFTITVLPLYFPNAIQDYDGNWYDAVVIGDQVWLAQNLRTTRYADGMPIPAGGSTTSTTDPYYYDYSSSGIPLKDRGLLYNWPAVMNGATSSDLNPSGVQGIAPTGWHVPSLSEYNQFINYVNSQSVYRYNNEDGKIGKSLAYTNFWTISGGAGNIGNDQLSNNKAQFNIIAAGMSFGSSFYDEYNFTYLWLATEDSQNYANMFAMAYDADGVYQYAENKSNGYSVRCVCDLSPLDFAAWYYEQYSSYNHQLPTE